MQTIPADQTAGQHQTGNPQMRQLRLRFGRLWSSRWRRWAVLAARFEAAAMTGDLSLDEAKDLAGAAAAVRFANPATRRKLATLTGWLFRYLTAAGAERWADVTTEMTRGWCFAAARRRGRWAAPAPSTVRNRQWALAVVCDALEAAGAEIDPALRPGREPRPPATRRSRPLTGPELGLVRAFADRGLAGSRRSAMVALGEAGASTAEIALVRACDVDLAAGTVRLGADRARVNALTGWGAEAIRRVLVVNGIDPSAHTRLCVTDTVGTRQGAQSVATRLCDVIRDAGLAETEAVTGGSIRLTTAAEILARDGIEAAARFLGSKSLDAAAAALGHDWNHTDNDHTGDNRKDGGGGGGFGGWGG